MPLPQNAPQPPAEQAGSGVVSLHMGLPVQPDAAAVGPVLRPDERQIRVQLERILGSEGFDASLRNRAFLRYVVDETLAGHADYIKGYSVAQEVFQRDVNFDPQLDPVVRIEARRLRRSLELYYLTAGKRDFVRIELPKGGYVPTFAFNRWARRQMADELRDELGQLPPDDAEPCSSLPMVIVRPFENLGDRPQDSWARGLADELVGCLLCHEGVAVLAECTGMAADSAASARRADPHLAAAFLLTGSLRTSASRLRIWAQLLHAASGRYLWVRAFDLAWGSENPWLVQEEVAKTIADTIAGPAGPLLKLLQRV